jgi:hypothetical protein
MQDANSWKEYQNDRILHVPIAAVVRVYGTDPGYAHLAEIIADPTNVWDAIAAAR